MVIKLIALDMDGTLLNHRQQITDYTRNMLIKMQEKGIGVVLASGRDLDSLMRYGKLLKLDQYQNSGYICLNGLTICNGNGQILLTNPGLNYHDGKIMEQIAKDFQLDMILFFESGVYVVEFGHAGIIEQHFQTRDKNLVLSIDEIPESAFDHLRKIALIQKRDYISKIMLKLQNRAKERFDLARVEPDWLEVNPYCINKGYALTQLAKIKEISLANIMAFGNGENDISMLQTAGCGIAMANAFDSVKAIADDVCGSCFEDGIGLYLAKKIK